jgi:hypothetical protein
VARRGEGLAEEAGHHPGPDNGNLHGDIMSAGSRRTK